MADLVREGAGDDAPVKVGFIWADSRQQVSELIKQLDESLETEVLYESRLGSVITSHVGSSAFAVRFLRSSPAKE